MKYRTAYFHTDVFRVLDLTLLPNKVSYINCKNYFDIQDAIKNKKIKGHIIPIAVAYAMAMAIDYIDCSSKKTIIGDFENVAKFLEYADPRVKETTQKILWLIRYVNVYTNKELGNILMREAHHLANSEHAQRNELGKYGCSLIKHGMQVLTHGNGGSLSTVHMGSALAPLYTAIMKKENFNIYVCESRPNLDGAKIVAWELEECGVKPILITDGCAATLMKDGRINLVIVSANVVSRNGDVSSDAGSYSLAVLAKYHKIPFYVTCLWKDFSKKMKDGLDFTSDLLKSDEVGIIEGKRIYPLDVSVYQPKEDVIPAELLSGIITNCGIVKPVNGEKIERFFVS